MSLRAFIGVIFFSLALIAAIIAVMMNTGMFMHGD